MRHGARALCAIMCGWGVGGLSVWAADPLPEMQGLQGLQDAHPGVQVQRASAQTLQIFGVPLAFGVSPAASAESFRLQYADALGTTADELVAADGLRGVPQGQPLMYNPQAQQYKFKLFKYQQVRGGLDVYGAGLRVLVRNTENFATVLANSSVRPLGAFAVNPALATKNFDPAIDAATGMERFSEQRKTIWAGSDQKQATPRVAVTFVGELGQSDNGPYQKWRFVVDAETGEVLHREDLVVRQDVTGNVSGMVTQGNAAEQCSPEVLTPFPYANVSISGGASSTADMAGDFVISNPGTTSVTVQSPMSGTYFNVLNAAGSTENLSLSVTPPGPANFVHNSANTDELVRAQANGYANANEVRDWILFFDPASPVISTQTNFTVRVNRTDSACPGNAWYDGVSINFCQSDIPNSPNTSFAGISQHEYGHHLVAAGGSGQGEYGEGMSDVVAMLVADNPNLGLGFFYNQCATPLRSADNTCQYSPTSCSSCGSAIHLCGQVLSGSVWDLRNNLAANFPSTYMDILGPLTLASVQVHGGSSVTPTISNDFLILDDDDGDLGNGTPHSVEIIAAFQAHNMYAGPPPANDACSSAEAICSGMSVSGSTSSATNNGSASCGTSDASPDVWYAYTPTASGSATFSLCSGTVYDTVLSVHTGCPGSAGNEVGCDDDGCGTSGGPSSVTASVTAGVTYYVRVTGWSGAAGSYTLTVTGPSCSPDVLSIDFPSGTPAVIQPGVATVMQVQILDGLETYVSGSGMLHYRFSGGSYLASPLVSIGGNLYDATLPAASCGDTPEFYVSAQGNLGTTVTNPLDAPTTVYVAQVGALTVIMADNFETDQGWTPTNLGASSGDWQRGVPVNDAGWDYDPLADSDGSGRCYLTQNVVGNTDVDGGAVRLTSPVIDMSATGVSISYDYYLRLTDTDGVDRLLIEINNNGGTGTWTEIARHDTDGGLAWRSNTITEADLLTAGVTLTSNMVMRYTVNDGDAQSIVESGLDAFSVSAFTCTPAGTCSDGILNQGEDLIDCGGPCAACDCLIDGDCDDTLFCTGVESCDAFGLCQTGADPCPGQLCDEGLAVCVDCFDNVDCTDGLFCNGAETCDFGACLAGSDPCPGMACDEPSGSCQVFCDSADVNCDGTVNAGDLLVVRNGANWEQPAGSAADPRTDVNGDATVNAGDLLVIRGGGVWETSTGPCVCP